MLDRYATHPQSLLSDRAVPELSNQKMNAYLKEIAHLSGVQKRLTFHIARHSFATTITLCLKSYQNRVDIFQKLGAFIILSNFPL
jgi:hypothetical protein